MLAAISSDFFALKMHCFFNLFWDDFWMDFEAPRPSQIELSPTRGAYFEKITFFVSESIFDETWRENETQKVTTLALNIY